MRKQIKFRLWNECGDKSRMFYSVDEVMECLKQQIIFDCNPLKKNGYDHRGDGSEFMQYTGLKDKNGRDIYEGDICRIKFNINDVEDYIYNSLTENEIHSESRVFSVESPLFNNQQELNVGDIEVIGNIYETPNLIK